MTREFDIDTELRSIIGKIVRGEATDQDRARLDDLQRERVRRVKPWNAFERLVRARR